MSNVTAITSGGLALQLALAGIRIETPGAPEDAENLLESYLDDPRGAAVVIVEDCYRSRFSEWFHERLRRHRGRPLVVYCPAFTTDTLDVDAYLSSVLKPALGYEIRLE